MRDLHPVLYIGLPLGSFLLCLLFAFAGSDPYNQYILADEKGYVEQSTVLLLVPACFLALWMFWKSETFPAGWLRYWSLLLFLGALYFAGEEASWGQHYFGWSTPEWLDNLNDQGETNIHNTHGIFDQTPRALLSTGALLAILLPVFLHRKRKLWNPATDWREWIIPTMASLPAGIFAFSIGLPQKIYGKYGDKSPDIPEWFDSCFSVGSTAN